MDLRELTKGVREAWSARQVFGEPVERDGVTVIPAATLIGGGGGGGGDQQPSKDGETGAQGGAGMGFGGLMWPAGAFEIRGDRVTWRPAIDVTRVLVMALVLAIALVRARARARR